MTWHPYLPEPRPVFGLEPGDPEPVPLEALRVARDLCRDFRTPPRQFRRRTSKGMAGAYYPASDIVAVDPSSADDGMGANDGYYATFLHELLHATGHPSRLSRATTGDYSPLGQAREEGTVWFAQRIVLQKIGFDGEAINWHTGSPDLPLDRRSAKEAAAWILG